MRSASVGRATGPPDRWCRGGSRGVVPASIGRASGPPDGWACGGGPHCATLASVGRASGPPTAQRQRRRARPPRAFRGTSGSSVPCSWDRSSRGFLGTWMWAPALGRRFDARVRGEDELAEPLDDRPHRVVVALEPRIDIRVRRHDRASSTRCPSSGVRDAPGGAGGPRRRRVGVAIGGGRGGIAFLEEGRHFRHIDGTL
jgi:hypothetical protein